MIRTRLKWSSKMAHFLLPASLALVPLLSRHPSSNLLHCDLYYTSRKFCDCLSHGCETLPKVYKTPVIMTPTIHRLPIWKHHQLMLSKLDTLHSSCSVQTFKKKKRISAEATLSYILVSKSSWLLCQCVCQVYCWCCLFSMNPRKISQMCFSATAQRGGYELWKHGESLAQWRH